MVTRLYRVHGAGASIHLEPVPVCAESLDPNYVFVLDCNTTIYMWYGKNAKNTLKSKSRLMAEKINKNERKNKSEINTEMMGSESQEFWKSIGASGPVKPVVNILHISVFLLLLAVFYDEYIYLEMLQRCYDY